MTDFLLEDSGRHAVESAATFRALESYVSAGPSLTQWTDTAFIGINAGAPNYAPVQSDASGSWDTSTAGQIKSTLSGGFNVWSRRLDAAVTDAQRIKITVSDLLQTYTVAVEYPSSGGLASGVWVQLTPTAAILFFNGTLVTNSAISSVSGAGTWEFRFANQVARWYRNGTIVWSAFYGQVSGVTGNPFQAFGAANGTGAITDAEGGDDPGVTIANTITDDYNRADSTTVGDPGAGSGYFCRAWGTGSWSLVSGKLTRNQVGGGGSDNDYLDHETLLTSDDQFIECDVDNQYAYGVIHCRSSGLGFNCYMAYIDPGGGAFIAKNYNGSFSTIGSAGFTPAASVHLRLECQGTQQRLYVNGSLLVTTNDTTIASGRQVGFNCSWVSGRALPTYDNLSAGIL